MENIKDFIINEQIENDIHYREKIVESGEVFEAEVKVPERECSLWVRGVDEPVCKLNLISLNIRFGSVTLPAEGVLAVSTPPHQRRKGFMTKLLNHCLKRMKLRVPMAFLYGIKDFYPKFGFSTCLADSEIQIHTGSRYHLDVDSGILIQKGDFTDLQEIVSLYNKIHSKRPLTLSREKKWDQIPRDKAWKPGSVINLAKKNDKLLGYMITEKKIWGWNTKVGMGGSKEFSKIWEIVSTDLTSAYNLLDHALKDAKKQDCSKISFWEPTDSSVGKAARLIGCNVILSYPSNAGGMGKILNRKKFLELLKPELDRRANTISCGLNKNEDLLTRLISGHVITNSSTLLGFSLGYEKFEDYDFGKLNVISDNDRETLSVWFPGGGTSGLLIPFAHKLDRF